MKYVLAQLGIGLYREKRKKIIWKNYPSKNTHQRVFPNATYSPWLDDKKFIDIYQQIKKYTLLDIYRLFELYELVKQTELIEGDILEIGVFKGGSGALIAKVAEKQASKKVFLIDTFEGVVKAGEKDTKYKGGEHFDTSLNDVKQLIKSNKIQNTKVIKGIFPDEFKEPINKISFIHCDVDVYNSCKDIMDFCLPYTSIGSIIVFDDYGFDGCEGVTSFCDEMRSNKEFHFIHNLNGHAIFIKHQ